ncbi:creatininase family protein [Conexibacter arvalis]|uniref:Creatinine amidohydrolase n=1 Tax=Conexibacter arvalis TaxID=912552 RepID=A0A840IIB2_9ACTN|nr:creatininase family protein [Conexibacter arvalis]MBB4664065.1 creatinine amidohydrolase [Conexibacter arvalis]
MTVVRWAEATREELAALLPEAVVVLPVGATEQHGPHLATGMDAVAAERLAAAAAERAGAARGGAAPADPANGGAARAGAAQGGGQPVTVVLAPTLAFGASEHHLPFGGTLSLSAATLARVLGELIASATSSGARRLLLLNGHGGNSAVCAQAAADAARLHGIVAAAADYWALAAADGPWGTSYPGHAGAFETALMRALRPEGVRDGELRPSPGTWPSAPDGLRLEQPGAWAAIDGFTDDPRDGAEADGAAAFERLVDAVARAIEAVAAAPPASAPSAAPKEPAR